jgi:hypothetical protein
MSSSDAAPLPRLGEVFFDVRGSSRSMRLSWYADTGVAVFSIWQGGMCTGTFRLPIGDLARMIETLQRGPQGNARPRPVGEQDWANVETGYSRADYGRDEQDYGRDEQDYGRDEPRESRRSGYRRDDLGDPRRAGYPPEEPASAGAAGYGQDAFSDRPYHGYQAEPDAAERGSHERFVPPYVRGTGDDYGNDIPAWDPDVPATGRRLAYRSDLPVVRSGGEDYDEPPWESAGYSDEPRYQLPAEAADPSPGRTGKHSAARNPGTG